MAQNVFHPDAWTRAKNRFIEDLTVEEQRVFFQASPETILYEASAMEKINQTQSTTRRIVTKLQPFVEAVEQYGHALDVYSNTYPLIMGPLWGTIRVVLHLARESGKYFDKIADMFNRISDLLPRLRMYEKLFEAHENLVQSLSVVYLDVLTFCSDAKAMFRRSKHTLLKSVWKPFERQFESRMESFRRHQKEMEEAVLLSHMIEAKDSRELVRLNQAQVAKERRDEERLRVFASLSSAVDYKAKHRKLQELRHEGSGTWVIQHPTYTAWKQSTTSTGLVCHGIPGSGKSVLTSLIIEDYIEEPDVPAKTIYFYCDYADLPTLQPVNVYRALLQQLFFKGLLTEDAINAIIKTVTENFHGPDEKTLTNLLYATVQSCPGLRVIVDGLDECERNVQEAITGTLCHLVTIGDTVVKVLITSRDEAYLLARLRGFSRMHISSDASRADIRSYISYSIVSSLASGNLTLQNQALKNEIIARLAEKAQGMFLWVHFQITDLCDAASDEEIRKILEHLPEGLNDTYTRIFAKIAKSASKGTVLKVMMWMTCARRPLRVAELQEAVAFDSADRRWSIDKIPDGDKIIRSCLGLVVRESDDGQVRLAHHTVHQYLVSPHESVRGTNSDEYTIGAYSWPELQSFRCDYGSAEKMVGLMCVTYLSFSDFETSVGFKKRVDLTSAFKDRGPISIPTALGLGKHLQRIPYKFFGSEKHFKPPDIDYSKYLIIDSGNQRQSTEYKSRFALLEYVIEHWGWHTRCISSKSEAWAQFMHIIQYNILPFEFRPWGPNQHFGLIGCKGCPVPESDDLGPKKLPLMGLLHWAAEIGHLNVLEMIEPPLQEYLKHERDHDETLLIASRHGQTAFVEMLLGQRKFDLFDGRAIQSAFRSGNASTLDLLLKADIIQNALIHKGYSSSHLIKICAQGLHQAASNGRADIVKTVFANYVHTDATDATTGLCLAARNGHLQVVREYAFSGGVNYYGRPERETGNTALHYAAANGHEEIVVFLVQHGSGCDVQNLLGETALIKAAQNGHFNVTEVLVEMGADSLIGGGEPYSLSFPGRFAQINYSYLELPQPTAIHHAARFGHDNVVTILYPLGDLTCGTSRMNVLHIGAAFGHPQVVQALLLKGADIESKDALNLTALHYASSMGHSSVTRLLVERGCNVNSVADGGYTALHFAVMRGEIETIKFLVARGAKVTAKLNDGDTPLHLAAVGANMDTIRTLVECGSPLESVNRGGWTAWDEAYHCESRGNMLALIELGAKWMRLGVFVWAVRRDDGDLLGILLSRLPTMTWEEQERAAGYIGLVAADEVMWTKDTESVQTLRAWVAERESRSANIGTSNGD